MSNISDPKSFVFAFNEASACMTLNESVRRLDVDERALFRIADVLNERGQKRFINLARNSQDARISIPLYAGNGLVFKIIPESYADSSKTELFKLPAITVDHVQGRDTSFLIKSYPWVAGGGVTSQDIESLREKLHSVGLEFNTQDDKPRNIHRLPDKDRTLVCIDEDIYHGKLNNTDLAQAWVDYVHDIFPIYQRAELPRQDTNQDFSYYSIHDKSAELKTFRPDRVVNDAVLDTEQGVSVQEKQSFSRRFANLLHLDF